MWQQGQTLLQVKTCSTVQRNNYKVHIGQCIIIIITIDSANVASWKLSWPSAPSTQEAHDLAGAVQYQTIPMAMQYHFISLHINPHMSSHIHVANLPSPICFSLNISIPIPILIKDRMVAGPCHAGSICVAHLDLPQPRIHLGLGS